MTPYYMSGPTLIGFSGGRTSAYLLRQILDAHGGCLPQHVKVSFQNTGKEREETLAFVNECSTRWNVDIAWLEFCPHSPDKTKVVDFASASRNGEPFAALIEQRQLLPNPLMRFCTIDLKMRRAEKYARTILGWDRWDAVTGIRFDEPKRWAKIGPRNAAKKDRWRTVAPLVDAQVDRADVLAYWNASPFDLQLPVIDGETVGGNCDLCFLKGRAKIEALATANPEALDWWIEREAWTVEHERIRVAAGARKGRDNPRTLLFRADRPSYSELKQQVETGVRASSPPRPRKAKIVDDDSDCACHD